MLNSYSREKQKEKGQKGGEEHICLEKSIGNLYDVDFVSKLVSIAS